MRQTNATCLGSNGETWLWQKQWGAIHSVKAAMLETWERGCSVTCPLWAIVNSVYILQCSTTTHQTCTDLSPVCNAGWQSKDTRLIPCDVSYRLWQRVTVRSSSHGTVLPWCNALTILLWSVSSGRWKDHKVWGWTHTGCWTMSNMYRMCNGQTGPHQKWSSKVERWETSPTKQWACRLQRLRSANAGGWKALQGWRWKVHHVVFSPFSGKERDGDCGRLRNKGFENHEDEFCDLCCWR